MHIINLQLLFLFIRKDNYISPNTEESKITVQYNGKEYCFNEKDIYQKYSDQIGEYVKGTLETKQYDDGTVSYDIISLE